MSDESITYRGGPIFDGNRLRQGLALKVVRGRMIALDREDRVAPGAQDVDLRGDILSPGYVDLQVNGGDGVMLNDDPSAATLARMAAAHRRLGATTILPTLITDTPEQVRAAIDATAEAVEAGVDGIGGLHLEGPHLSVARKGAHDPSLIRPMTDADERALLEAAQRLPVLKVTLAPENVSPEQVTRLNAAGILISLGHTDADFDTCLAYQRAGARCVTHLFNAMSQLGNRAPGLVGAALHSGGLSAGLIADAVHVHPAAMRAALAAKSGPGQILLVSDAMAPAGTDATGFTLNGRAITRKDGRLTLADGTLAGADLDLTRAISILVNEVGVEPELALRMATSVPADLAGIGGGAGRLLPGQPCAPIRIGADLGSCAPLPDPAMA